MDPDEYDVTVVGGGPAGSAAAVFCARRGLATAVFDRGRSSLKRCAYLENYLGFPAGIDIETFYDLLHDHVTTAGGDIVAEVVESVERTDTGFRVTTGDGTVVETDRVVGVGSPAVREPHRRYLPVFPEHPRHDAVVVGALDERRLRAETLRGEQCPLGLVSVDVALGLFERHRRDETDGFADARFVGRAQCYTDYVPPERLAEGPTGGPEQLRIDGGVGVHRVFETAL